MWIYRLQNASTLSLKIFFYKAAFCGVFYDNHQFKVFLELGIELK